MTKSISVVETQPNDGFTLYMPGKVCFSLALVPYAELKQSEGTSPDGSVSKSRHSRSGSASGVVVTSDTAVKEEV